MEEKKPKYENFEECRDKTHNGNGVESKENSITFDEIEKRRRKRESLLYTTLRLAEHDPSCTPEQISAAKLRGISDGSYKMTSEDAKELDEHVRGMAKKREKEIDQYYLYLIDDLDDVRDHDLKATAMYCFDPKIRKLTGNKLETLYKVKLESGLGKKNRWSSSLQERTKSIASDDLLPEHIKKLLSVMPKPKTKEEEKYQKMFDALVLKKVERDVFPIFKRDQDKAFSTLEKRITQTKNQRVKDVYAHLKDTYKGYTELEVIGVNENFQDPETGRKGVLPSLHQRIALYHIKEEKKFGVFDGCGTGKTAIAILAQPLIKQKLKDEEDKGFRRTVVVCPNAAKKAWKKGLTGETHERYLSEKLSEKDGDVVVINGEQKDENFLQKLKDAKWIVVNYEQLTTQVNGSKKLFVETLLGLGVDYTIFDECHHIKTKRKMTKGGKKTDPKPTYSFAAQILAHNSEYLTLLTGSPIPDTLSDYAVMYNLLNRKACPDPSDFEKLYNNNARALYTLFAEKTVRRTFEDLDESIEYGESEELVNLTPLQRKIYDYIAEVDPVNALIQARKAILDPRLVDPTILQAVGALGKVNHTHSAKYRKLEEILTSDDGPIAKGEKFIIFSSTFRDGVTQEYKKLKKRYEKLGLAKEYESLQLEKSLEVLIQKSLSKKFGRDFKIGIIDGTVKKIEEREKIVDGLNDGLSGIICTTDTGGESLDFTAASHAIFLDEDYTPTTMYQALSRLIRKGQKRKVEISYLQAKDSVDEKIKTYVRRKKIINTIATDGLPITDEEKRFLGDAKGPDKLWQSERKRRIGGKSINVNRATIEDIGNIITKKIKRKRGVSRPNTYEGTGEPTLAQEVVRKIGLNRSGCWHGARFVNNEYMQAYDQLSPIAVNKARVCDLLSRALKGKVEFPKTVLAEGAGPGSLYEAYQNLTHLIRKAGFQVPIVTDRDFAKPMLAHSKNPNKVLGDMTGKDSVFKKNTFDMIDHGSLPLLLNSGQVKESLLEASRILKDEGLLEIVLKNYRFKPGFHNALEGLGFEVLAKEEGFFMSPDYYQHLKEKFGKHYADNWSSKLKGTEFILAKRTDNPGTVSSEDLWFETNAPDESLEQEQEKRVEAAESIQIVKTVSPKPFKGRGRPPKVSLPEKPDKQLNGKFEVDARTGLVIRKVSNE